MARATIRVNDEVIKELPVEESPKGRVGELKLEFGNGDLNILRDKLNELIRKVNGD